MAAMVDTAKDLMTFAGGPSMIGTAGLLAYARKVLDSSERDPSKGWLALGAGVALMAWMAVFLTWAAPTVLRSWRADGDANVTLVLLSVTWLAAGVLVVLLLRGAPSAARYLTEAYREGEGPWLVRVLRRVVR